MLLFQPFTLTPNAMQKSFSNLYASSLTLLIVLLLAPSLSGIAQRSGSSNQSEGGSMSLGISTASTGPGINLAYKFGKALSVRAGYDGLNAQVALDTDIYTDINTGIDTRIDTARYNLDVGLKISSLFVIADLYYLGPLFISAGAGYNLINLNADAQHEDGPITGALRLRVSSPQKITPYVGLGLGRKVAKNRRVAFSADIGLFYLGQQNYTINATGDLLILTPEGSTQDHKTVEEIRSTLDMIAIYPVFKFGVSYKFLR